MNISEFAKPVTAKKLNESLAKRFGKRIALESFTLAQLHNARNKLRTRLSQIEMNESFSNVVESDEYQKSKLFLDVLNAEISERGDIDDDMLEGAKPDFLDLDKDGDKKEPMKKAAKDKKSKGIKAMVDAGNKKADAEAKESVVREGAEDQAEIVMAAKDMVDRVTGWMEDTAEMKTESMLDLADAVRDEMGVDQSNQYVETIKASLDELYASLESTRGALSSGVMMLTGEGEMQPPMGGDDMAAGLEPTVDMDDAAGVVPPADDDFAAAPAAAGGEEPAGRETRESVELDEFGGMDSNDPADLNLQKSIQNKFGSGPKQNIKGKQYWTFDKDGNKVPAEFMLDDPAVKMMIDAGVLKLNPQALAKLKAMRGDRRAAPSESVDSRKLARTLSKKK